MAQYLIKRIALAIVTLWILATAVFMIVHVLPGNVGRHVLGPFASTVDVATYNHEIGTDRPLINQYGSVMKSIATLDFGNSYQSKQSVNPKIKDALFRSAKLAGLALLLTVPISIMGGRFAAQRRNSLADRTIVTLGLATSSIPEFVTATVLAWIFCIEFKLFHVYANPPDGASIIGQFRYLFMPSLAMAIVYFGYIARMARAGIAGALDAEFTRTAVMKGLPNGVVMRRHVMRNGMGPTISVVGVSIGYLFGGIVGVERVFNYHGIGSTIIAAVDSHDVPMLQAAVLCVGIVYMLATLAADLAIAFLNPRVVLAGNR